MGRGVPIGVLLISGCLVADSYARTWTDKSGKEAEGTYVRVKDGRVVIQAGRRIVQVPIADLSPQDVEYVRKKLPKSRQDELPPLAEPRTWTDTKGRELEARFVSADKKDGELQVIVSKAKDGKVVTIPFAKLSDEDQAFVSQELAQQNKGNLLPPGQAVPLAANSPPQLAAAPPIIQQPQFPTPPQMAPVAPQPPNAIGPSVPIGPHRPRLPHAPTIPPIARQTPFPTQPVQQPVPTPQPVQVPQPIPTPQPAPVPQPPPQPVFNPQLANADGYYCGKCMKQVPSSVKAGDNCPHCGAFFEYKDNGAGNKEYAPITSYATNWEFTPRFYGKIGLLIGTAVAGFLAKLCAGNKSALAPRQISGRAVLSSDGTWSHGQSALGWRDYHRRDSSGCLCDRDARRYAERRHLAAAPLGGLARLRSDCRSPPDCP